MKPPHKYIYPLVETVNRFWILSKVSWFFVLVQAAAAYFSEVIEDKEVISMLLSAPGTSRIEIRDRIILVILYDTAIRADELLCLNVTDVNISCSEPYLRIHGKGDKERIVCQRRAFCYLSNTSAFIIHVVPAEKPRFSTQ